MIPSEIVCVLSILLLALIGTSDSRFLDASGALASHRCLHRRFARLLSLTYTSWVVLTSSINTQHISVTRRTLCLLRLWVYSQDSVCKFNVTNLLNIRVVFDGWVGGKEKKKNKQE